VPIKGSTKQCRTDMFKDFQIKTRILFHKDQAAETHFDCHALYESIIQYTK